MVIIFTVLSVDTKARVVTRIEARCEQLSADECESIENRFQDLTGMDYRTSEFEKKLMFKLMDRPYERFSYSLKKEDLTEEIVLSIMAQPKKKIQNISINYNVDVNLPELASYIPVQSGDYFDRNKLQSIRSSLTNFLNDRGFQDVAVVFNVKEAERNVNIEVNIKFKSVTKVEDVKIATSNPRLIGRVKQRFQDFKGEILDRLRFKLAVDQLSRELFESGFYDSEVSVLPEEKVDDGKGVILRVKVKYGKLYSFHFEGNAYRSRTELLKLYNDTVKKESDNLEASFKSEIIKSYNSIGLYGTTVDIHRFVGVNKSETSFENFFVHIKEGKKKKVSSVSFRGNSFASDDDLNKLYYKYASVLASRGYLDTAYLDEFKSKLREWYLSNGFVFVEVSDSILEETGDRTEVFFNIRERQQAKLNSINIDQIDKDLEAFISNKLKNKVGEPINIPALESDLDTVLDELHERGFYFVEVGNLDDENLLNYTSNFSEVGLNIKLRSAEKVKLRSILVTGYNKTKLDVIMREIPVQQGDYISPSDVALVRERLVSLDLFSSVRATPEVYKNEESGNEHKEVNLLIQVSEKAFGVGEIAPGFRTDLGAKASLGLRYNNILGMNRSASLNFAVNRRIDYSDFDTRRRREEKDLLEYSAKFNFTEPYLLPEIFSSRVQLDASSSYQRQRFVSFDADIFRVSPQISKTFFDKLTMSVKYQYEEIQQFDATNEDFNDDFTIGSVTPSFSLDLRDDPVRPRRGAFLGFDWEFANPYFFSMDDDDITVNYYRMTSRNSFYIPLADHFTLAFSLAGGVQKNFANEIQRDENGEPLRDSDGNIVRKGFIPSTKVFRLDGIDTVRGFDGQEINRLLDGRNIGEVVVNDMAYFLNVKLEPRYYVNDSLAVGGFFDAGRVFVDQFRPLDLRSSVGLSFKLLTPVGSLDFDYGVKLKRERIESEVRESFGRFHLTIGFF